MEYLESIGLYLYQYLKIPEFILPYIYYIPDYTSPEDFCKTVEPKIQHIITSYLDLEDITRIYEDNYITHFIELFNHNMPTLRDANIQGLTNVFKFLVRNGNIVTEYEMVEAIIHGRLDILKHIIQQGIAPQNLLLDEAVQHGHLEIVKFLVEIGIRPLDDTIDIAIKYGKEQVVNYLLNYKF